MTTKTELSPSETTKPKKKWGKWLWALLLLLLALLIAWLIWQLVACRDKHDQAEREKQSLQSKVDDLGKELAKAKQAKSDEPKKEPSAPTCSPTVSASLKNNIKDAISSKNYAALEGYMASAVNVVFAASEKGGNVTPAQAVTDLQYLNAATTPWNFALPAATIASYDAGFYTTYFDDNTFTGKSANNYVVSFDFDSCAKINVIFVAASADLLM